MESPVDFPELMAGRPSIAQPLRPARRYTMRNRGVARRPPLGDTVNERDVESPSAPRRRRPRAAPANPPEPSVPRRPPDSRRARAPGLSQLFTYNLSALANMLSRGAAARYSREFGVTLMEWRVIGCLALSAPMSLQQISRRFDLDKGQSSRTVAALLTRGLVHRSVNGDDRRSIMLRLTPSGWRLYQRILASARERSERLLGCLEARERRIFLRSFNRVMTEARVIYLEEKGGQRVGRHNGAGHGRLSAGVRKPHA